MQSNVSFNVSLNLIKIKVTVLGNLSLFLISMVMRMLWFIYRELKIITELVQEEFSLQFSSTFLIKGKTRNLREKLFPRLLDSQFSLLSSTARILNFFLTTACRVATIHCSVANGQIHLLKPLQDVYVFIFIYLNIFDTSFLGFLVIRLPIPSLHCAEAASGGVL